jgi:hypothetical protein
MALLVLWVVRHVTQTRNDVDTAADDALHCEPVAADELMAVPDRCREAVLRNTMTPAFMSWYRRYPGGRVDLLRCVRGENVRGYAVTLTRSRRDGDFATIVHVDVCGEEPGTWRDVLVATEAFLRRNRVTHIHAVSSYRPLRLALHSCGYHRVRSIPVRLRDRLRKLAAVREWHVTALEGDLAYLFE